MIVFLLLACTVSDATVVEVVEKQGMTGVVPGGYGWFECGKDDSFASYFEATNAAGKRVDGVVCCGLLKRCTVRW